jgi:hypothetical protein
VYPRRKSDGKHDLKLQLHDPTSPRSKHRMPNYSKERSHTPATQIQTHVISDRADDVLFFGFKEGKWYLLVEVLEVLIGLMTL